MSAPSTYATQVTYHQARTGGPVVRRVITDGHTTMWFDISVLRTYRQVNPTYQGCITMVGNRWQAVDVDGSTVVGMFGDYADAEAFLVRRRTGKTSAMKWTGGRPQRNVPTCDWCGNDLHHGVCRRTDLHWDHAA